MKRTLWARELTVQYTLCTPRVAIDGRAIVKAADAAAIVVPLLETQAVERFLVLHLDAKKRLLGVQDVGRGGLTETVVAVRAIFAACLGERNSQAIICAHNHVSGDCEPSPDDIELTRKIVEAGRLFEIEVLDHICIGHQCYVSFKATGRMRRM